LNKKLLAKRQYFLYISTPLFYVYIGDFIKSISYNAESELSYYKFYFYLTTSSVIVKFNNLTWIIQKKFAVLKNFK